jgi:hypothetical protein
MTKKEFIDKINIFPIYNKDYDTLNFLMNNLEPKLFVKIMEELVKGNLFVSDFERIFLDTEYSSVLKNNLEKQAELDGLMSKIVDFRQVILNDPTFFLDPTTSTIGIRRVNNPDDPGYDLYNEQYERTRNRLINEMFSAMPNDSEVVKAVKLRIYSLISNNQNSGFSFDDLLLFAKSYILPLSIENEILDVYDYEFIYANNISELDMKKIKVLTKLLKREDAGGDF